MPTFKKIIFETIHSATADMDAVHWDTYDDDLKRMIRALSRSGFQGPKVFKLQQREHHEGANDPRATFILISPEVDQFQLCHPSDIELRTVRFGLCTLQRILKSAESEHHIVYAGDEFLSRLRNHCGPLNCQVYKVPSNSSRRSTEPQSGPESTSSFTYTMGAFEINLESFNVHSGLSKLVESTPTKAIQNSHYVQQVNIWNNSILAANPTRDLSSQVSETHVFAGMYVDIHCLAPAENPLRLCLWGIANLLRSPSGLRTLTQTGKVIINCLNSRRGGSIDFQFATNPLMELSYAIQFAVFDEAVHVLMPTHLLHHKDFAHWLGAVERSFRSRTVHQLDAAAWKSLQKQYSSAVRKLNSYAKRSK